MGSNPIPSTTFAAYAAGFESQKRLNAFIAQLVRAGDSKSLSCRFESCWMHHFFMRNRAYRRHINEKLKWKRRLYHGGEWIRLFQSGVHGLQAKKRGDIPPNPYYVKTPKPCSCALCDYAHKHRELSTSHKKQEEAYLWEINQLNSPSNEWDYLDREDYWIEESIWDLDDFRMSDLDILDHYLEQGRQPFRIPFLELVKFR